MKLDHFLIPEAKINSGWINAKLETMKLLEESRQNTLHSNIFFESSSRVMEIKTKINKYFICIGKPIHVTPSIAMF